MECQFANVWSVFKVLANSHLYSIKFQVSDTPTKCRCIDSLTYCGTIYEKYPDNKPMGYPFDRVISAKGWEEFKTQNMFDADVTIKFTPQFHH